MSTSRKNTMPKLRYGCCWQVDPESISKLDKVPLLEIEMGLVTPDIVWIPELGSSNTSSSVRDMFNKWIRSYLEVARLVKRLDIGEGDAVGSRVCFAL